MASRRPRGGTHGRPGRSRDILDRTNFVPLYFQLAEMLKERIESGRWPPGARFFSESEIEAEFDVSRTVIRPALALLESDGQLVRIKGRGNFVATPKQSVVIQGMSRLLSGSDPTGLCVDILEARAIIPESTVAQTLGLGSRNAKVAHLTARVHRGDAPVFICNSFAALSRLPWILDAAKARSRGDLAGSTPAQVRFDHAQASVQTAFVSVWEAQQLRLAPGDPCFLASYLEFPVSPPGRVSSPVEFARLVFRTDLSLKLALA